MNVDANVKCVQEHFTAKRISPRVRKMDPAGRNRTKTPPRMSGCRFGAKAAAAGPDCFPGGQGAAPSRNRPMPLNARRLRERCLLDRDPDLWSGAAAHRSGKSPPGGLPAWLSCRDRQPTHTSGDLVDAKLRAPWPRPGWRVLTTTTSQDRPSRPRSGNPRRPAGSAAPPSVPDWRSNAARTGP